MTNSTAEKVKELPILFKAEMVRAILEGRKTQTRRVFKGTTEHKGPYNPAYMEVHKNAPGWKTICPYGQIGSRLWVRETYCLEDGLDEAPERPTDGRPFKEDEDGNLTVPHYRATEPEPNIVTEEQFANEDDKTKWKPSIFMPRWASRINLEITDVRVERLNDITDRDALAEGITLRGMTRFEGEAKGEYASLWESINGKGSWDLNSWVWVIGFKVV